MSAFRFGHKKHATKPRPEVNWAQLKHDINIAILIGPLRDVRSRIDKVIEKHRGEQCEGTNTATKRRTDFPASSKAP